jgi:hypothetical protein
MDKHWIVIYKILLIKVSENNKKCSLIVTFYKFLRNQIEKNIID